MINKVANIIATALKVVPRYFLFLSTKYPAITKYRIKDRIVVVNIPVMLSSPIFFTRGNFESPEKIVALYTQKQYVNPTSNDVIITFMNVYVENE